MILTALKELAEREGLVKNADYQPCPVRWLITIGPGGAFLGMRDTLTKPSTSKGKATAATFDVPKRSKRSAQDLPEFLVDKAEYVFGWVEEADQVERGRRRHQLYVEELNRACEHTQDEAVKALLAFFRAFDNGQVTVGPPDSMNPGDLFGFEYSADTDGPRLISSRPALVTYWGCRRRERDNTPGKKSKSHVDAVETGGCEQLQQCLVTGELCKPVRLHPKVKGIPPISETKGGVPLTSINLPAMTAFESYDLGAFACATVSPSASDAYEKALNRLLSVGYPSPVDGIPLPIRHFRLSESSVVTFWSKGSDDVVDLFADSVGEGQPEAVEALYKATWKGRPVNLDDSAAFYALTLSGGIGRATIRNWLETTLGAELRNVKQHFEDLKIHRLAADADKPHPLIGLLRQLAVLGKLDNIPPNLASAVFAAILAGRPFPRLLLDASVRRVRAERTLYADRVALIKAYLLRARRSNFLSSIFPEVKPMLDEDCKTPAYRLGRLFAVLEKVRKDANTTIRDRYYGAASATPVMVFPQLLRKAPHHLAKLDSATYYEKLLQSICDALQPPNPFPTTLTLEEQGLFAIGYYHQVQALYTKRSNGTKPSETKR